MMIRRHMVVPSKVCCVEIMIAVTGLLHGAGAGAGNESRAVIFFRLLVLVEAVDSMHGVDSYPDCVFMAPYRFKV